MSKTHVLQKQQLYRSSNLNNTLYKNE